MPGCGLQPRPGYVRVPRRWGMTTTGLTPDAPSSPAKHSAPGRPQARDPASMSVPAFRLVMPMAGFGRHQPVDRFDEVGELHVRLHIITALRNRGAGRLAPVMRGREALADLLADRAGQFVGKVINAAAFQ